MLCINDICVFFSGGVILRKKSKKLKKMLNIWSFQKKVVPLHPNFRLREHAHCVARYLLGRYSALFG